MPGIGTRTSLDKGDLRPLFTFGNGGDTDGRPPKDCFAERALLLALGEIVETSVADLDVDFNFCDVIRFNHPYTGENSLNRFEPGGPARQAGPEHRDQPRPDPAQPGQHRSHQGHREPVGAGHGGVGTGLRCAACWRRC